MRPGLTLLLSLAALPAAGDPVLDLPIDCTLGASCHIQQYVDRDPGKGARDFTCGGLSYDGHKGTDFALPTLAHMRAGVDVQASAPGIVTGLRDGVEDRVYGPDNAAAVEGRECGNGVVLRHEDGWETQYCHLKKGSVRVRKGDRVERGAILGQVGISGKAQFPHVHLSVRHNGAVVDPFDTGDTAQCNASGGSLWRETPIYEASGLIDAGFADAVPEYAQVQDGTATRASLPGDAGALVFFVLAFGGQKGDILRLTVEGPGGQLMQQDMTLDRAQAQFFRAAGRRLKGPSWPAGTYEGTASLLRKGVEVDRTLATVSVE
ncbi:M23 family metallopeptidase [Ruegeria pomeroyi]|uniref:M23 family metallopeptidase n=1 Tax=Ruegeria alba TaxID=2916756 RepID=A0ABS9NXD8_9RHOB|nr:M23 family metallopeptidase [Ruegeria alba]MCE8513436.1 M23 family metallopeptidase [Ruegeria pomeroyi]MCE8520313.1 M23 family metallopeptidase [Ruegeria pomeroyi]MCE8525139.1 M23 family metallopeptidase [Ruegeria pomeroyi]MCE8530196.1 M23 family metallopeptidase [Ruegeria pomeroyi]MCE8534978.1 M23 family metallopeptidase [Ruegeria pomeroyi]